MNVGRAMGAAARRSLEPARWVRRVMYEIAIVLTVWSTLTPNQWIEMLVILLWMSVMVLVGFGVHRVVKWVVRRVYRQTRPRPDPDWGLLGKGCRACLVAGMLVGLEIPFRVAFLVSRPLLEGHVRYYHEAVPYDTPLPGPRLCGVLPVKITRLSPRGADVWIIGGGMMYYRSDGDGGSIVGSTEHPADRWFAGRSRGWGYR